MADPRLPGVFGDVQPLLEHYGYLGVGGMLLLECGAGAPNDRLSSLYS